jgi:hypothetical protein
MMSLATFENPLGLGDIEKWPIPEFAGETYEGELKFSA